MEDLRESFHKMQQTPGSRGEIVNPGDKISIFGLNETVLWTSTEHRWTDGFPPKYDQYTLLNLQEIFIALFVLSVLQFIGIIIVKSRKSKDLREEEHKTKKILHTFESLN